MKALVMEDFGGPEVLKYRDVKNPVLNSNEILVHSKAIGLNFADIYRRREGYQLGGKLPYILGYEGAGVIEAVGGGVTEYKVGDRIGFADVPFANAEYVLLPEDRAIPLPDQISFEIAASTLLQGLTADFLIHDSYKVRANQHVVIHAISGGVGQLLLQMIKSKGACALGITSSLIKKEIALSLGADQVFLRTENWKKDILNYTGEDEGVDVVYDGVGSTLQDSLDIVKAGGTVVFYGTAGGNPAQIDPRKLIAESKVLAGGDLWKMVTTRSDRIRRANRLFNLLLTDKIKLPSPTVFPLSEGAEAHRLLESGKSTGKVLMIP